MIADSITEEIRDIRHNLAAQFGNDLDLILADIRHREDSDGRTYLSFPPRVASNNPDDPIDTAKSSAGSITRE
jgi:hypothetical protein